MGYATGAVGVCPSLPDAVIGVAQWPHHVQSHQQCVRGLVGPQPRQPWVFCRCTWASLCMYWYHMGLNVHVPDELWCTNFSKYCCTLDFKFWKCLSMFLAWFSSVLCCPLTDLHVFLKCSEYQSRVSLGHCKELLPLCPTGGFPLHSCWHLRGKQVLNFSVFQCIHFSTKFMIWCHLKKSLPPTKI